MHVKDLCELQWVTHMGHLQVSSYAVEKGHRESCASPHVRIMSPHHICRS